MDAPSTTTIIVLVAALIGVLLSVAPVLPGTLAIPLGALAIGAIDGFDAFAWWFWVIQAVLVALYLAVDQIAQALGVRRVGGSKQAMVGGAIGVFIGPLALAPVLNLLAVLVGPPVGAVVGTVLGERYARRARMEGETSSPEHAAVAAGQASYRKLGVVALVAFVASIVAKIALVSIQIAVLAVAVL